MIDDKLRQIGEQAHVLSPEALRAALSAVTRAHPSDIRAYLELGKLAEAADDLAQALGWYDQANQADRHNFWPYYLRAKLAERRGDLPAAFRHIDDGLEMCSGRVSRQEYDNLGKYYCDLKAIDSGTSRGGQLVDLRHATRPGRAIADAMRVSLVKDEDDIIYAGLASSYRSGLRCFVVADNGSVDGTVDEIRRFARDHDDAIVYIVLDPVVGHYQAAKTMGLVRLGESVMKALGIPIGWVFPLDGDEELHIPEGAADLAELLDRADAAGAKLLAYLFCNCASPQPIEHNATLEALPGPYRIGLPSWPTPVRKVAFRLSADAFIEEGNHYCSFDRIGIGQIMVGWENSLHLKHYPVRTIEQLRKKVLNGARSLEKYDGPSYIGAHWRHDAELFAREGDAFLHDKLERFIEKAVSA